MTAIPKEFEARTWDEEIASPRRHSFEPRHAYPQIDSLALANEVLEELRNLPVSQLRRRVAYLEKVVSRQDEKIQTHDAILARLQTFLEPPDSNRDEYAVWMESKDADNYAGMYVAFVPGTGPIASADSIKELKSKYAGHPLSKQVAIVSVPNEAA